MYFGNQQRCQLVIFTSLASAFLFSTSAVCATAEAQIALASGAPFSAIETHTTQGLIVSSFKVARASNGNTYQEIPARQGSVPNAIIRDYVGGREIYLNRQTKTYDIHLISSPPIKRAANNDAEIRESVARFSTQQPTHTDDADTEVQIEPLGTRMVNGRVELGTRRTYLRLPTSSKLRQKIWVTWWMPSLQLQAESDGYDESGKLVSSTEFVELHSEEPDASLFTIPDGYTPTSGMKR